MKLGSLLKAFDAKRSLLYLFLIAVIISGGIWVFLLFETEPPTIQIKLPSEYISTRPFDILIQDQGRGLKNISVSLLTRSGEQSLVSEQYDPPIGDKKITVALSRRMLKTKEGPTILRVTAKDDSYQQLFSGNETTVKKEVILDLTSPTIQLVKDDRYINFGGSGLLLYRTSKDSIRSGVRIGKHFFPGYKGHFEDPNLHAVFFAHPYDTPAEEKPALITEDVAGNSRQASFSYSLKNVKEKKRNINITGSYIERKVAPLLDGGAVTQGQLEAVFVQVNHHLRSENEAIIRKVCQKSANKILWRSVFHQLSNSQVKANFADSRSYVYQGKTIDHAYHLGYDLAVTKNYPIEAANSGLIVFTGDLGIYGNTVIIDHGFGIFTMYSHMSSIAVRKGQDVKKKQIIGTTGETGLAVGDHLHYATLIHGVPVLPLEWWDAKWIQDNILSKIQESRADNL